MESENGTNTNMENEDDDNTWQRATVNTARKRSLVTSPINHERKRPNLAEAPTTTNNRFSILEDLFEDQQATTSTLGSEEEQSSVSSKPPPIYIPDVADISKIIKNISKVIESNEFSFKSMRDGQIRMLVKTIDSYRKLVKHLDEKQIKFHTYQIKEERAFRFVIKNLHHTTPISEIKFEIEKLGHKVRNITNIRSSVTKQMLPIFFIDIEPKKNNVEVYNIKHINNAIVRVEPPKKSNNVVQCYRCQQYGHTKSYCRKTYSCVKCGLGHATAECPKNRDTPPRCVNCLQNHPANYRGCKVYQEIHQQKHTENTPIYYRQTNINRSYN